MPMFEMIAMLACSTFDSLTLLWNGMHHTIFISPEETWWGKRETCSCKYSLLKMQKNFQHGTECTKLKIK